MRKTISLCIILGLLLQLVLPLYGQQANKITIAVVDFQNTSGKRDLDYLQKSIPEMLITNLAKKERLNIVERSRLEDAVKEMQLGMTGIVDQSKAIELGKAVGANAIMVGSFLDIGGVIRINARLIDVQTSKVIKAESVQGRTGQEIFDLMDQLANSIEAQLVGQPKTEEKAVTQQPTDRRVTQKQEPARKTTEQPPTVSQKKGGSKTTLYILGGAALIGGGVAAAMLLGGGGGNGGGEENPNSNVTITINIP
ncbi:MAG: hypothetical protein Kow0042_03780 [Calditrichia bacterium]